MAMNSARGGAQTTDQTESVQGYFRRVLLENPKLIKGKSNKILLDRWSDEHPGEVITGSIRQGLSNAKSLLKRTRRKRKAKSNGEMEPSEPRAEVAKRPLPKKGALDQLEEQIDESLIMARNLDREGLGEVISLLRRARNAVVWMGGQ